MNDKEFANCVLWSLCDVATEFSRVHEVAAASEILGNIKNGKSVIIDADELKELRDSQSKMFLGLKPGSPVPEEPKKRDGDLFLAPKVGVTEGAGNFGC